MTWADIRKELDRLATLTDGWDGEGGPAPHPDTLPMAEVILAGLESLYSDPPDRIHCSLNGSVMLEWMPGGLYQKMEIGHDPRRGVVVETREVRR